MGSYSTARGGGGAAISVMRRPALSSMMIYVLMAAVLVFSVRAASVKLPWSTTQVNTRRSGSKA